MRSLRCRRDRIRPGPHAYAAGAVPSWSGNDAVLAVRAGAGLDGFGAGLVAGEEPAGGDAADVVALEGGDVAEVGVDAGDDLAAGGGDVLDGHLAGGLGGAVAAGAVELAEVGDL